MIPTTLTHRGVPLGALRSDSAMCNSSCLAGACQRVIVTTPAYENSMSLSNQDVSTAP